MKTTRLMTLLVLGTTTFGAALAADQVRDRVRDPAAATAKDQDRLRTRDQDVYGSQLMTRQERAAFRAQMRAAKTAEEREQIRAAHHEAMKVRAKERGVTLPDTPPAQPGGMGPGGGAGAGAGAGAGPGSGAGGRAGGGSRSGAGGQ